MTITAEAMDLLSLDELEQELSVTEPLEAAEFQPNFSSGPSLSFKLPAGWNLGLKELPGTAMTEAAFTLDGHEYLLTKDAALQMTSLIGLQKDYVTRTPGPLIQDHLNYWMNHLENKTYKLLHRGDEGLAFTKGTVVPISNLRLLETAVDGIRKEYGPDTEIKADYKRFHDLRRTNFRLVVPEKYRAIQTARSDSDMFSFGVDIQNSLTAEFPTTLRGYLFAWICTNGQTSTHATSGTYSRKGHWEEEDALTWAGTSVEDILVGLEHEISNVQALTEIEIDGEVNATLRDIFAKYKVPASAREGIIAALIESDDLTMFGVLSAITQAANNMEFKPSTVARLLSIGGDLPSAVTGRCSACHRLPVV